jgi:hypothetical protein
MPNLSPQGDRLQPSEAFFNAFPFPLTEGKSGVVRRARINGAPTGSRQVLGHIFVVQCGLI